MTIKLTSNEKQYIEFKKLIIPIESTIQTLRNNYAAIDALIAAKFPHVIPSITVRQPGKSVL
jgi:hypothetical protein